MKPTTLVYAVGNVISIRHDVLEGVIYYITWPDYIYYIYGSTFITERKDR